MFSWGHLARWTTVISVNICVQLPHISCNQIIVTTTMLLFSNSLFEKLWPILLANVQGWSTSLVWHARRWGVWQTCLMKKYKWEVLYSLTHSIFQHLVEKSMMNRPPLALSDRWCRGQFVLETPPEITQPNPTNSPSNVELLLQKVSGATSWISGERLWQVCIHC